MRLFKLIVFLAAFLLFQIELIIAKVFLPQFGGSYMVWGACIVFFQCVLLLGYLYVHFILRKVGVTKYLPFHMVLLALPLFFFPGRPLVEGAANAHLPLVISVFWQLAVTIGVVFFVLSTTSIILQKWLAASNRSERTNPYVLYAVSNAGSFLALISYPFLFEAFFDLSTQLTMWRIAYVVLFALHLVAVKRIGAVSCEEGASSGDVPPLERADTQRWFLLSAASTVMFISVTNILTYEVTPFPLLWILPLCIYLASFTFNFQRNPWCPQWITPNIYRIIGLAVVLYALVHRRLFPFIIDVAGLLFVLFGICMYIGSELSRRRPAHPAHLTTFYAVIALGGFVGGMFVTWVVPLLADSMVEYLVGLLLLAFALAMEDRGYLFGMRNLRLVFYMTFALIMGARALTAYNVLIIACIVITIVTIFALYRTRPRGIALALAMLIGLDGLLLQLWEGRFFLERHRNYYGIYKVYDENERRFILNGTTLHGAQHLDPKLAHEPLAYYHALTPIGKVFTSGAFVFSRIGVIGEGSGGLAAYLKEGQTMDYFELDPDVDVIARTRFSFLAGAKGPVRVLFGDARIRMRGIPDHSYDLLIVDAFSGDSIPAHLLTVEAIREYKRCLRADGMIVFHVSNRYVELFPVFAANAPRLNAFVAYGSNEPLLGRDAFATRWVCYTWDKEAYERVSSLLFWRRTPSRRLPRVRAWTDQYSNITPLIKLEAFLSPLRNFKPFYWPVGTRSAAGNFYVTEGEVHLAQKRYEEALPYFQDALAADPENAKAYYGLGNVSVGLNRPDHAMTYYRKAIDLGSDFTAAYLALGKLLLAQGDREQARRILLDARELFLGQLNECGMREADAYLDELAQPQEARHAE